MPKASATTLNRIKSNVVSGLSWSAARTTNLHIDANIFPRNATILAYKQRIKVNRDSVMVFADEAPQYNWAHPCKYLLHDAKTGECYAEIRAQFPPYMNEDPPATFKPFHEPFPILKGIHTFPILPIFRCPIRWVKGKRYAVLFSGASNNRHTNDLEFLYRTLRDIYNIAESHIYVLNYDGTINYSGGPKPVGNWPGDNTPYRMTVHGKGTKAALDSVLDTLKGKLEKDDLLLLHTNNHGGHDGTQSYLCTYSGPDYYAADFATKLATLPKIHSLMVMMEQCHSGGFNNSIVALSPATLTSVASACEELRSSIGGANFDPFARDWIAAMTGSTPSGGVLASNPDTDGSGKVSAIEAFNYADAVKNPYDTPVYNESSVNAGKVTLGKRYGYFWPPWCRIIEKVLLPYYERKPRAEFYEILHTRLVPLMMELEPKLQTLTSAQEEELTAEATKLVKKVMGR